MIKQNVGQNVQVCSLRITRCRCRPSLTRFNGKRQLIGNSKSWTRTMMGSWNVLSWGFLFSRWASGVVVAIIVAQTLSRIIARFMWSLRSWIRLSGKIVWVVSWRKIKMIVLKKNIQNMNNTNKNGHKRPKTSKMTKNNQIWQISIPDINFPF